MEEIIISAKQQAWLPDGTTLVTTPHAIDKDTDLDFMSELYAALSGGEQITETVSADRQSVAGNGTAVGDQNLSNMPVRGGFLENDFSIPILWGVSNTPVDTPATTTTTATATTSVTHRHISWILLILIVLALIIFLRGLFLPDSVKVN